MRRILWAVLAVLLAGQGWGATYYVSTSGDDTNNGTSAATPWAHHPWDVNASAAVKATALSGDDVVIMKKGDTWYDCQLTPDNNGTSGHQITTRTDDGWGDGDAVLSAAYDPSTFTWTDVGDGIFSAPATVHSYVVVFNNAHMTEETVTPTTPGVGEFGWAEDVLYVNVNGAASPETGTLLAAKRDSIIADGGDYITFQNLVAESGNNNNAALGVVQQLTEDGVIYDGITVRWFKYYGIYQFQGTGGKVINCIVYNNDLGTIGIHFNSGVVNGVLSNTEVYEVGGTSGYGVVIQNTNEMDIYQNYIHDCNNYGITIRGSSSSNKFHENVVSNNGRGNYPTGAGAGLLLGVAITETASNNLVYRNIFDSNYQNIINNSNAGTGGNSYYYNILKNSTTNGIKITQDPNDVPILFVNNTVIHNPSADNVDPNTGHGIECMSEKCTILNNIFVIKTGGAAQGVAINTNYSNCVIGNNLYYNEYGEGGTYGKLDSTLYASLATWKTALQSDAGIVGIDGQSGTAEAMAVDGDPLFRSATDYRLTAASPARDAGTDLCATLIDATDLAGRQICSSGVFVGRGAAPDIGAYEYWGSGAGARFLLGLGVR